MSLYRRDGEVERENTNVKTIRYTRLNVIKLLILMPLGQSEFQHCLGNTGDPWGFFTVAERIAG